MSDYELYGGLPPHNDTDTSYGAAISMLDSADTIRARVWRHLRDHDSSGVTCDEVEQALDMLHTTVSARLRELVLMGAIHDTGERRPGRSGRNQRVYRSSI